MKVTLLQIGNIRAFKKETISDFSSRINLFSGRNNCGKSTILRSIDAIQQNPFDWEAYARAGGGIPVAHIKVECVTSTDGEPISGWGNVPRDFYFQFSTNAQGRFELKCHSGTINSCLQPQRPHGRVIPFWSNRKTSGYTHKSDAQTFQENRGNLANINALIDNVLSQGDETASKLREYVKSILGVDLAVEFVSGGKAAGHRISQDQVLKIEALGDGIPHALWLIVALLTERDKVFLLEEPETDLHPTAIKQLCNLVIAASEHNQFFISTHSNIVLRSLGIESTNIYRVVPENQVGIPNSKITRVETPQERLDLLVDLGYSVSDYDLYEAWVIFEESSAQRLFRDFLIPIFVPGLRGKLGLISANGVPQMEATVDDFRRVMVYVGQQPIYDEKLWVVADGDEPGKTTTQKLKNKFKKIPEHRILNWQKENIEKYIPEQYLEAASQASGVPLGSKDFNQKQKFNHELISILAAQSDGALKSALSQTAQELIEFLKTIESELDK